MILVLVDYILLLRPFVSSFLLRVVSVYDAAFFDDGMTLIICLNMIYPSLMLNKSAAEEQLDDIIHGSRKKKGNKKKRKYEEWYRD